MRKYAAILMALVLCLSAPGFVRAAERDAVNSLQELNLLDREGNTAEKLDAQLSRAEGLTMVLKAIGYSQAEAEKESAICRAQGEAEAILAIQKATAEGLNLIKNVGADPALIKLRSLEAFEKVADGKSTKIIIPADIQNMAGLVSGIAEVLK